MFENLSCESIIILYLSQHYKYRSDIIYLQKLRLTYVALRSKRHTILPTLRRSCILLFIWLQKIYIWVDKLDYYKTTLFNFHTCMGKSIPYATLIRFFNIASASIRSIKAIETFTSAVYIYSSHIYSCCSTTRNQKSNEKASASIYALAAVGRLKAVRWSRICFARVYRISVLCVLFLHSLSVSQMFYM